MARNPEDGRSRAALAILDKCIPAYKPAGEVVTLDLDPDPVFAHGQIMRAVAGGEVSADTGAMLISMLEAGQRIAGAGELAERVEMLEDLSARLSRLAESQAEEIKMLSLAPQNGKNNPGQTGGN
jgi:hypothetical protein